MTTQRNEVISVTTLPLVARQIGIDEDWLADIAICMEPEDGLIWVCDPEHPDGIMAFSDVGIESLHDLIREHKAQGNFPPSTAV